MIPRASARAQTLDEHIMWAPTGLGGTLRVWARRKASHPGANLALTYEDIPSLTSLPRRVAVVGGADTGCQIASIFADLGSVRQLV